MITIHLERLVWSSVESFQAYSRLFDAFLEEMRADGAPGWRWEYAPKRLVVPARDADRLRDLLREVGLRLTGPSGNPTL